MSVSIPTGTDWSPHFKPDELEAKREEHPGAIELSEAFAWTMLATLTAYRIGTAPITVRPCAAACTPEFGFITAPVSAGGGLPSAIIGRPYPFVSGGRWYNACGCRNANGCSCSKLSEVLLPGPVGAVLKVTIDGVELDASAYRVDNGYRLVRLDGGEWPSCQDMAAGVDEVGSFAVTYYRGAAPNLLTRAAAGVLAWEFLQSRLGNECRLPWNVTQLTRDGESVEFEGGDLRAVAASFPEVSAIVNFYNPNGLKKPPRVIDPDALNRERVTTWQRSS